MGGPLLHRASHTTCHGTGEVFCVVSSAHVCSYSAAPFHNLYRFFRRKTKQGIYENHKEKRRVVILGVGLATAGVVRAGKVVEAAGASS